MGGLWFCSDAGPCGYALYRQLLEQGRLSDGGYSCYGFRKVGESGQDGLAGYSEVSTLLRSGDLSWRVSAG